MHQKPLTSRPLLQHLLQLFYLYTHQKNQFFNKPTIWRKKSQHTRSHTRSISQHIHFPLLFLKRNAIKKERFLSLYMDFEGMMCVSVFGIQ
jgi:hypothetical protein